MKFFVLALMLISSWYHPVHVSVTNIDLETDSGLVEISIKVFSEDFESLILQQYQVRLGLTDQVQPGNEIDVINQYLSNNLTLLLNGKDRANLIYQNCRINEEATWFVYNYSCPGKITKVEIYNSLMTELFEDQTNLVIVTYNNHQNGYRLDNKYRDISFNIK